MLCVVTTDKQLLKNCNRPRRNLGRCSNYEELLAEEKLKQMFESKNDMEQQRFWIKLSYAIIFIITVTWIIIINPYNIFQNSNLLFSKSVCCIPLLILAFAWIILKYRLRKNIEYITSSGQSHSNDNKIILHLGMYVDLLMLLSMAIFASMIIVLTGYLILDDLSAVEKKIVLEHEKPSSTDYGIKVQEIFLQSNEIFQPICDFNFEVKKVVESDRLLVVAQRGDNSGTWANTAKVSLLNAPDGKMVRIYSELMFASLVIAFTCESIRLYKEFVSKCNYLNTFYLQLLNSFMGKTLCITKSVSIDYFESTVLEVNKWLSKNGDMKYFELQYYQMKFVEDEIRSFLKPVRTQVNRIGFVSGFISTTVSMIFATMSSISNIELAAMSTILVFVAGGAFIYLAILTNLMSFITNYDKAEAETTKIIRFLVLVLETVFKSHENYKREEQEFFQRWDV